MKKFVLAILLITTALLTQKVSAQVRIKASGSEYLSDRLQGETIRVGDLDYILFDSTHVSLGALTAPVSSLASSKARVFRKRVSRLGAVELGLLIVVNNTGKVKVYHSKGLNLTIAHQDALAQGSGTSIVKSRFNAAVQALGSGAQVSRFLNAGSTVELRLQALASLLANNYQSTIDNIIR